MTRTEARQRSQQQGVKVAVDSLLVKKLFHKQHNRGMTLLEYPTRCVRAGEVHEVVTTTQRHLSPGDRIDDVGFLGFVEIRNAGVIEKGDWLYAGETLIGRVAGFDDCHFPNHYNILIEAERLMTASDAGICLADTFLFIGDADASPERSTS